MFLPADYRHFNGQKRAFGSGSGPLKHNTGSYRTSFSKSTQKLRKKHDFPLVFQKCTQIDQNRAFVQFCRKTAFSACVPGAIPPTRSKRRTSRCRFPVRFCLARRQIALLCIYLILLCPCLPSPIACLEFVQTPQVNPAADQREATSAIEGRRGT